MNTISSRGLQIDFKTQRFIKSFWLTFNKSFLAFILIQFKNNNKKRSYKFNQIKNRKMNTQKHASIFLEMILSVSRCNGGQEHTEKQKYISIMLYKTNIAPKYLKNLHALNQLDCSAEICNCLLTSLLLSLLNNHNQMQMWH